MKRKDQTPAELVRRIYEAARDISRETRGGLAGDLDRINHGRAPVERWQAIRRRRAELGVMDGVERAGRQVVRVAGRVVAGQLVRRAVGNLVAAVAELAAFVPEFDEGEVVVADGSNDSLVFEPGSAVPVYVAAPATAARLDELRQLVYVRLVELDELLKDYPDPFARLAAVAGRIAEKLLPTREAARVGAWFGKVAAA